MKKFHIEIDIDKDGYMFICEDRCSGEHYSVKETMGIDDLIDQITTCLADYLHNEYDDIPHSEMEFWSNKSDEILGKSDIPDKDLKDWQKEVMKANFQKAKADFQKAQILKKHDVVNHPSHYTDGKIEVIDFIEDKKFDFCLGNAVKYISRAGKKDKSKEIEDLEKAVWYIQRRIEQLKKAQENSINTEESKI